jgi:hypothetical protein
VGDVVADEGGDHLRIAHTFALTTSAQQCGHRS